MFHRALITSVTLALLVFSQGVARAHGHGHWGGHHHFGGIGWGGGYRHWGGYGGGYWGGYRPYYFGGYRYGFRPRIGIGIGFGYPYYGGGYGSYFGGYPYYSGSSYYVGYPYSNYYYPSYYYGGYGIPTYGSYYGYPSCYSPGATYGINGVVLSAQVQNPVIVAQAPNVRVFAQQSFGVTPVYENRETRLNRYLALGDEQFRAGRYLNALARYRQAEDVDEDQTAVFDRKAMAYMANGQYRLAAAALKKGMRLDAQFMSQGVSLATLYGDRIEESKLHLESLASEAMANPNDGDLLALMAMALHRSGEPERGERFALAATKLMKVNDRILFAQPRPQAPREIQVAPKAADEPRIEMAKVVTPKQI